MRWVGANATLFSITGAITIGVENMGIRFAMIPPAVLVYVLFHIGEAITVGVNDFRLWLGLNVRYKREQDVQG
jgi:hypothetical protein